MREAAEEQNELLRLVAAERDIWRTQYFNSRDAARRLALRDARHEWERLVRELRAHHMDPVEAALLDCLTTRYHEMLNLLTPQENEVPQSGR